METKTITIAVGGTTVVTAAVAAALLAPCGPLGGDTAPPDDHPPKLDVGTVDPPPDDDRLSPPFGVNLDYWQSFYPIATQVTDARLLAQIHAPGVRVDADGYPVDESHSLFRLILWNVAHQVHVADYVVTWSGSGSVTLGRNCSSTGTIDGGFIMHTTGECYLDVTGRISDLKVVRTGVFVCASDPFGEYATAGACEDGTERIDVAEAYRRAPARWRWMPAMHRDLTRYAGMRAMLAARVNESPASSPDSYTRETSLSYSATGMAYRHLFDLAVTVGHDYVWWCTPWNADDVGAWARHVADAAKAAGFRGLVVSELANEWWNAIFRANQNVVRLLAERYPDQTPTGTNAGALALDAASKYVPRETVKLCEAQDAALGEQSRCVLAGHSGGLDPSGLDPYTTPPRPYDLTTHSFSSGTYNKRLLDTLRSLPGGERIDYFATAPYTTGHTLRHVPTRDEYRGIVLERMKTGKWRATATANGIRAENATRAALGWAPLGAAWYEFGTHNEAQGATQAEALAVMTAVEQDPDDAELLDAHADYLRHLVVELTDLPWGPKTAFVQTMTTSAPWGYWDPRVACEQHAKCLAMMRALTYASDAVGTP